MNLRVSKHKLRSLVFAATFATTIAAHGQTHVLPIDPTSAPQESSPITEVAPQANSPRQATQWEITASQRATANLAAQNGIHISEIRNDAPATYRIKPGDTLWSISGHFLKSPWKWPALWGLNQAQIQNPHRIYPGQVLVLTRNGDRAYLQIGDNVGMTGPIPTVRLGPTIRSEAIEDTAIPVLPPDAVIPFLQHGIIIPRNEFENSPRIVALPERRLLLTVGDKVYVRGGTIDPAVQRTYLAYTSPEPIRDPVTGDILGFQATYLGKLKFIREGATSNPENYNPLEVPSTFEITESVQEMRIGDRLTPANTEQELLTDYLPSPAPAGMEGRIVSIYGGNAIRHASLYQVVLLNRGHLDGLERGNVVALWRPGQEVRDTTAPDTGWNINRLNRRQATTIMTPDERYGLAMVFRTYDNLSYAIIMQATDSVELGDNFTSP